MTRSWGCESESAMYSSIVIVRSAGWGRAAPRPPAYVKSSMLNASDCFMLNASLSTIEPERHRTRSPRREDDHQSAVRTSIGRACAVCRRCDRPLAAGHHKAGRAARCKISFRPNRRSLNDLLILRGSSETHHHVLSWVQHGPHQRIWAGQHTK